jgi:hypothetical protein
MNSKYLSPKAREGGGGGVKETIRKTKRQSRLYCSFHVQYHQIAKDPIRSHGEQKCYASE